MSAALDKLGLNEVRRGLMGVALVGVLALAGCYNPDPLSAQKKYQPYERSTFFPDHRAMRPLPLGVIAREMPLSNDPRNTGIGPDGLMRTIPIPVTSELLARGRHSFDIYCATCHGLLGDGESAVAKKMPLRPPPSLIVHNDHELLRPDQLPPWLPTPIEPNPGTPAGRIQAFLPVPQVEGTQLAASPEQAQNDREEAQAPRGGGLHPHFWPGNVFRVISHGYGLMPAYANELDPEDRWAVIAYLDALRLSQRANAATLSPQARHSLEEASR